MLALDHSSSYQISGRRARHYWAGLLAMIVCGVLLAACGSSGTKAAQPASGSVSQTAAVTVVIKNYGYNPANLTVPPGAIVTVRNDDLAIHTVTADKAATFNTGNVSRGVTTTFTAPQQRGVYPFHCMFHNYMTGALTVS